MMSFKIEHEYVHEASSVKDTGDNYNFQQLIEKVMKYDERILLTTFETKFSTKRCRQTKY